MTPTQTNLPNKSVVRRAIAKARRKNKVKQSKMNPLPTKPNSSPATVKIKSVCCSGTNQPFVCGPLNKPLPIIPPEPIVILDCRS